MKRIWFFVSLVFTLVGIWLLLPGVPVVPLAEADRLVTEKDLGFQVVGWAAFEVCLVPILVDFWEGQPFNVKYAVSRFGLLAWLAFLPHGGFLDFLLSGVVFLLGFGLVELSWLLRWWQADEALAG